MNKRENERKKKRKKKKKKKKRQYNLEKRKKERKEMEGKCSRRLHVMYVMYINIYTLCKLHRVISIAYKRRGR